MPFVPLGSRKRLDVIMDADKETSRNQMRARDMAAYRSWEGAAPGSSGYRFAKHPTCMGQLRGPDVPYKDAGSPWRPPSAERDGPAAQRSMEHAPVGACWDKSHRTLALKSQSMPSLQSAGSTVVDHKEEARKIREACNPISVELRRWEHLANVTKDSSTGMIQLPERPKPEPPKPLVKTAGLVNFPKYMLINNCHLKQTDMQRYVEAEARARKEAEEQAAEAKALGISLDRLHAMEAEPEESGVPWQTASWGAPRLKKGGKHWAGSSMPAGKSMRTSNPFRLG
mmetsp:Transcript_86559/g.149797  ORF Transcript_86559/g.149797 Transcript_86559/m.149797 type:complete len:284 (-) Transcript_86559:114-965(-)